MAPAERAIILDVGTEWLRAGFSTFAEPKLVDSNLVCEETLRTSDFTLQTHVTVGRESARLALMGKAKSCIESGQVRDWNSLEHLWQYTFCKLLGDGADNKLDFPVMCTASLLAPREHLERMTSLMFERFQVSAFYISSTCPLALFAAGG